ncbi:MAG: bifunctional [glutamate--ammonia ligase]-adenylyl-L-tyrosine phosphorylase/[glutamate--ammonia-ligase] adenylyltransferase, partial [Salinisphaera sp.]|nr:bifunctional [glutamate--ammonia ligase]-adenylyl-L-tyrosine phosphorylase/[glutamate--ammonia-ligase] adenylyltransferase [Salinisphaera sp.]
MIEPDATAPPLAWSRFLADWSAANADEQAALRERGVLDDPAACAAYVLDTKPLDGASAEKPAEFAAALRRFRNARMAAIAWCDLMGAATLEQTLAALSSLADVCVAAALAHAECVLEGKVGGPQQANGLIVIGMGKLGGRELNFSSDVDLVFAFRRAATDDADAQEYYKRVAQRLVAGLSEQTADGFAYRVDTRLRPFGESGALVASIEAMENYYQTHGREWERYAWIKARPVAGDIEGGRQLIERLRPFVYRRYLDYGAFESIRDMKGLIEKQVARGEMRDNIKLGCGGIREIEFIAQAFQLIRGGHEPALQDNRLLPVLAYLGEAGHLPAAVTAELRDAYEFLRRLENRLQMWADRQTHELPADGAQRAALAAAMDHDDWSALTAAVGGWRSRVHAHFQQVFAAPHAEESDAGPGHALGVAWRDGAGEEPGMDALRELGYADPAAAWAALTELRSGALYAGLGHRGRRRLGQLVPLVVAAAATADRPDEVLGRVAGVLARIVGRTAYVDLLAQLV